MARPNQDASFRSYITDIHRFDLLTREQENELARRWTEHDDPEAAAELVQRNLRFVVKVAMGYRRYGRPVGDLIQEGNLGLLHAVRKFDPSRGTRLISYAVWWIKAYIQSYVIQSWSLVRVGTTQSQRRLFYKLPRALAEEPRDGETRVGRVQRLSKELSAAPRDVILMMNALQGRDLSLDVPVGGEEGGVTFGERVADDKPNPECITIEDDDSRVRRNLLDDAVSKLSAREREIIRLRHRTAEPMTLREVGREIGISRERVRQLESQALRKLKNIMVPRYRRSASSAA
jgi:RNA polymerase sigma-32 factor